MAYTDAAEAPAAPEQVSAQEEGASKISQEQANYRMGGPLVNCGLCQNFTGSAGSNPYQCTKVAGEISPYGLSAEYTRQDNPFLAGTQSSFDAAQDEAFDRTQDEAFDRTQDEAFDAAQDEAFDAGSEEPTEGPETPAQPPRLPLRQALRIGNRSY